MQNDAAGLTVPPSAPAPSGPQGGHGTASALPHSGSPHAGMPALDDSAAHISWFEFAPARLFYLPVVAYCAWLALRHRGAILPTNANPALPYSGFVGESKFEVLNQVQGPARQLIAPYRRIRRMDTDAATLDAARTAMTSLDLGFPIVAKPDLGMRGAGVQLLKNQEDLQAYIRDFPHGGDFLLQELIDAEGEAGVFYVRQPGEEKGRILSLTLKYFPRVTGDGKMTLRQLIDTDPRAGQLAHLYLDRHRDRLDTVIPMGQSVRLAFAGNHCRGTIFRNGNDYITDAMTASFDRIAHSIGEFFVGRFDVRFGDFSALQAGRGYRIIEINGAGGEATHIWDSRTRLHEAYATLMTQFRHLYEIGAQNRARGFAPPRLKDFLKAWTKERKLTANYPVTH